jgi:hypothetical protein
MDSLPHKAISIRQPWAWAIINAGKDIENRDWPTKFRGPVCIHAAKGMTKDEYYHANRAIQSAVGAVDQAWLDRWHGVTASPAKLQHGGIIGIAEVTDCVDASDSPWFFGAYGFVLRNVRPVNFIPVKGALGFFDWRANLPPATPTGER